MASRDRTPPTPTDLPQALADATADKRLDVLRHVAAGCSISQAARQVGISYKAAWQAIDTLSNLSGTPLVERTVGGLGGGGARITADGLQLLALAAELARARQQVLARFAGGAIGEGGLGLRTSMRNQLRCRVLHCAPLASGDPTVQVTLATPGGAKLVSSVTQESADLLGLRAGLPVLALCKATAVDVSLASSKTVAGALEGRIERCAPGARLDEVVLALTGGGHWVGFAKHPFKGQVGDAAVAVLSPAALVIGLAG
ncbi:MAG: TOBE domain-containing protein [Hydrogenophaga sp.]|uniref:TOBE domain-containing protein n=1 Tax=Hydrogenophaga sp. TaxID=1904254 RepID=UPI002AB96931|nr:TOBE domain-containing protein [Hydrogenophaga sp.]MDZ4103541.1 TOBE domain-containing protein [Hydrogenophaga sp.]